MIRLVDSLVIAFDLPGTYSERDYWSMPDPASMRALYELLGPGSQVFAFHQMSFGDPRCIVHDDEWQRLFVSMWAEAFGLGVQPEVLVETGGISRNIYGGPPAGGCQTTDRLYGRQVSAEGTTPTPLRLYCPEYWSLDMDDSNATRQRCLGVIDRLFVDADVLDLSTSQRHFDDRLPSWAKRSGMCSHIYSSIVGLEGWDRDHWLVGDTVSLACPS